VVNLRTLRWTSGEDVKQRIRNECTPKLEVAPIQDKMRTTKTWGTG